MKLEVYIDLVFAVNLIMDFILLLLMRKLTRRTVPIARLFIAAVLGGIGACVGLVIPLMRTGLIAIIYAICLCGGMLALAFSYRSVKILLRDICMYYAVTFLLGGVLNYIYYFTVAGYYITEFIKYFSERTMSLFFLILYAVIAGAFILLVKDIVDRVRKRKEQYYDVVFVFNNESKVCRGFLDTGNQLFDPISMRPVILVELSEIKEILPEQLQTYCNGFSYDESRGEVYKDRMKVIPFHAVGTKEGILPAVVFPEVFIKVGTETKRYENLTVAVYKGVFAADKSYQVILHEKLI